MGLRLFSLLALVSCAFGAAKERTVESILPSLAYGPSCWSRIDLENLGDRTVSLDVESHRASGALVPLIDHPQLAVVLEAGERASFRLGIEDETGAAWVKVRERVPSAESTPVVAISGHTECVVENQLRTTAREVAFPLRNPTFSSDIDEMLGDLVSAVNTSEKAARLWLCYSSGNLYSVPGKVPSSVELTPLCSSDFEVQLPPFAARQFPVEHEGSSHFSMKTRGDAIVLQMLRPLGTGLRIYSVDSTIRFEGEAK